MVAQLRTDAAPTEAQMKLMIAQTLSDSFAYNAPVIVLDFEVDEGGGITGRFKDAARPRVFSFEIDEESVSFKPFVSGRMDSDDIDVQSWEEFSEGYSYRVDAGVGTGKKRTDKPTCGNTSYNCGKTCIGLTKNCKSFPSSSASKERIRKLTDEAKNYAQEIKKAGPLSEKLPELDAKRKTIKNSLKEAKALKNKLEPQTKEEKRQASIAKKENRVSDAVTKSVIKAGGITSPKQAEDAIKQIEQAFGGESKGKPRAPKGAAKALIDKFGIKNKEQSKVIIDGLKRYVSYD